MKYRELSRSYLTQKPQTPELSNPVIVGYLALLALALWCCAIVVTTPEEPQAQAQVGQAQE